MPPHKLTTDEFRFHTKVGPVNSNGCRLWLGGMFQSGYGQIAVGSSTDGTRRTKAAHVLALELALGRSLSPGMFALHTCDIRACVCTEGIGFYEINGILRHRRGHLWEGTCLENVADRKNKGRTASGKNNGRFTRPTKLSADDVLSIRKLAEEGDSWFELAMRFNVSHANIHYIIRRKSWRHI